MTNTDFSLDIVAGATAFGDGSHPSTQGALAALDALAHLHGWDRVLDMGCGSGILALKAAYQWHVPVVAADIEQEAVDAVVKNAIHNGLDSLVNAVRSDGYAYPLIKERAPYDLILSNILAEKLVEFSQDMMEVLTEDGVVVLSGILLWQADTVIEAHQQLGLTLLQRITVEDWVSLIMQRQ